MPDFVLRPLLNEDKNQIISLWNLSFGDSEDFIADMLEAGALLSTGVAAEDNGKILSCMFAFDGLECGGRKFSYLYALCTHPAARGKGFGRAVCRYAADMAYARGADCAVLRPGSEALERWYGKVLGAKPLCRSGFDRVVVEKFSPISAEEISPAEYISFRRGPWQASPELLRAQSCVHRHFGGAFLRVGDDVLCAEMQNNKLYIRELSASAPQISMSAAAAFFGAEEVYLAADNAAGLPLMALPVENLDFSGLKIPNPPFTLD